VISGGICGREQGLATAVPLWTGAGMFGGTPMLLHYRPLKTLSNIIDTDQTPWEKILACVLVKKQPKSIDSF